MTAHWVGYLCCLISTIFFGSNFACTKLSPVGDGVFLQWLMACAVFLAGLVVQVAEGFPHFYALPMLGGFLWVTGNMMCIPIIQTIGMGLGILIWSSTNMLFGWASGRFGWFGLKPEPPASALLNDLGVVVSIVGSVIFLFVGSGGARLPMDRETVSGFNAERRRPSDQEALLDDAENGGVDSHGEPFATDEEEEEDPEDVEAARYGLTKQQYQEIRSSFNQFDRDGNGQITKDEITEVIQICGFKATDGWVKDLMDEADRDDSGTIEWPEFLAALSGRQPSDPPVARIAKVPKSKDRPSRDGAAVPPVEPRTIKGRAQRLHRLARDAGRQNMRRLIAMAAALISGTFFGLQFDPIVYVQDNYKGASKDGLPYVFSYATGIYASSTMYFILYCFAKRGKPYLKPELVLPSLANGFMWVIGTISWIVANAILSEAISFPIITRMPGVIAALWGVLVFKEIRGRRNYIILVVAIVVTTIGAVVVGISKEIKTNQRKVELGDGGKDLVPL